MNQERILVIKLGALGDLVLCMAAFVAIRAHHPNAQIALLTGPSFAAFGQQMPWFDAIFTDPRPKVTDIGAWSKLIADVRHFAPTRVYDFQGKFRQSILFWGLGGPFFGPEWSGAACGCSHPRAWPPVPGMHYTDFLAAQLQKAGVSIRKNPELSWLDGPLTDFSLPERFALIIPGCAPTRLYKRWPAESYALLAQNLAEKGIVTFAIGTRADADSIADIRSFAPNVVDLSGQTTLGQLAALVRRAVCVVGNDTGPTHLSAALGARTVALMSDQVDPHWSAPKGHRTTWLQGKPLAALACDKVMDKLFD